MKRTLLPSEWVSLHDRSLDTKMTLKAFLRDLEVFPAPSPSQSSQGHPHLPCTIDKMVTGNIENSYKIDDKDGYHELLKAISSCTWRDLHSRAHLKVDLVCGYDRSF